MAARQVAAAANDVAVGQLWSAATRRRFCEATCRRQTAQRIHLAWERRHLAGELGLIMRARTAEASPQARPKPADPGPWDLTAKERKDRKESPELRTTKHAKYTKKKMSFSHKKSPEFTKRKTLFVPFCASSWRFVPTVAHHTKAKTDRIMAGQNHQSKFLMILSCYDSVAGPVPLCSRRSPWLIIRFESHPCNQRNLRLRAASSLGAVVEVQFSVWKKSRLAAHSFLMRKGRHQQPDSARSRLMIYAS